MSDKITNYKCPACTAPLYYDGETGKLQCDYCGSSYTIAEVEKLMEEKTEAAIDAAAESTEIPESPAEADIEIDGQLGAEENSSNQSWIMEDGMMACNCPSCGAELVCDQTTAAMSCPYCDNPTIIPISVANSLKPDLIIPFKFDKEAAKSALREHFKGKKLLPKVFSQENHIDEIKGIYVPFWLYDADVSADYEFSGTQLRSWRDRDFVYNETRYFNLERSGKIAFDNIPVDGSKQMNDELMESIEPFDVSQAVEFKNAYLAGYFANRYDVDSDTNKKRAGERIKSSVYQAFSATTSGYMSVGAKRGNIHIDKCRAKYAFYPVWILNTTWRDKKYIFAMNGQTGKFVGDLPIDKSLRWKWHAIYALAFSAAVFAFTWLLPMI